MVSQIPLKAYNDTYNYFLFLLSTVKHHSSWPSSFICDNNENVFMKRNQLRPLYWNLRRFGQGLNQKFYNPVSSVIELLSTCLFFTEGKTYSKLMLGTCFLRDVILMQFVVINVVYVTISFQFVANLQNYILFFNSVIMSNFTLYKLLLSNVTIL
jgi:hypothetical protein